MLGISLGSKRCSFSANVPLSVVDHMQIVCGEQERLWPLFRDGSMTVTDLATNVAVEITWDEEGILFRYLQVQK